MRVGYGGLAEVLHRWEGASTLSGISTAAPGRTGARRQPEYGFYTDVYQTERDGRVGGRVGSAAPPGIGGESGAGQRKARPNNCHVQSDGGCSPSNDGY
jgi:hypothetical protein